MALKTAPAVPTAQGGQLSGFERLRRWFRRRRETIVAWSILTPMVIWFLIMTYVPLIFLVVISFTEWNIISPPHWVGLANLKVIFSSYHDYFYLQVIGRTILYAIAILGLQIVGGFLVALIMNQDIKGKGLFRTMWYLPSIFSGAVVVLLFRIYLQRSNQGIFNMILWRFGLGPVDWIGSHFWMPLITVLFSVWMGIGFTVLFFLAGLQSIDLNLYDAARIDGANERQLLRYITIPQMTPMLLFITVTGMIGSMQMWEVPKILTAGGPDKMTYTLVYSIQNDSFGGLEFGLGTAQSLVLFALLLVFIGWQLNNYRKQYGV